MLSRLAFRSAVQNSNRSPLLVTGQKSLTTSSSDKNAEGSQRDLVNFPKRVRANHPPKTRLMIIPESWHELVAKKTGSTGLYTFFGTFGCFLVSKEYFVMEHDFIVGLGLFILGRTAYNKWGDQINEYVEKRYQASLDVHASFRQDEIDRCTELIKEEESAQWMATSYEDLIKAKKENVGLQLEAAYRERLNEAYQQVKKRLDYQLETANVHRRVEQKHMAEWIINGVTKSISSKQEDEALKKCISDLKTLA